MSKLIDLTGQKFGRLVVIKQVGRNKWNTFIWLCKCNCGKEKMVPGSCLKNGHTKSCGCIRRELGKEKYTTHGHLSAGKSTTYNAWNSMKQRCLNKCNSRYKDYGGRGIKICERWMSFPDFLKDMGERPTKNHSIDRINNNKNYCKSNCRWATAKQQARNRRNNHLETYRGRTQCLSAWTEEYDIACTTLSRRLYEYGWSMERALTTPTRKWRKHNET